MVSHGQAGDDGGRGGFERLPELSGRQPIRKRARRAANRRCRDGPAHDLGTARSRPLLKPYQNPVGIALYLGGLRTA